MARPNSSWRLLPANVVLFGPPGVGKTTVARQLAERLGRRHVDVDERVERENGASIPQIFDEQGEDGFRRLERQICLELARSAGQVIACGGGSLLDETVRRAMESSGTVICMRAEAETLRQRLPAGGGRPLLRDAGHRELQQMLLEREAVYDGFEIQVPTDGLPMSEIVERLTQIIHARERHALPVRQGSGYTIHFQRGLLQKASELLEADDLDGPCLIVSDARVASSWDGELTEALDLPVEILPAGEEAKRLELIKRLYEGFLVHGLDRQGILLAVGGGACLDAAGFAAATYMRGIRWIPVPTSLLALVDASVGGKVAVDLPQGKNLVGAFHPPAAVWADPNTLRTLPSREWSHGMAEVIKAGIIGDPRLFSWIEGGYEGPTDEWILRALRVKIEIVESDPLERGRRAALNMGHTVAHALEAASGYAIAHGSAVAIGMLAEATMASALGLADSKLPGRIQRALERCGLPTVPPTLDTEAVMAAMKDDKKSRAGEQRFALPLAVGQVDHEVHVPPGVVRQVLESMQEAA